MHAGDGAHDERVEAAPDVAFPARHGRDVGLHGGVAVALRDLRVAAREEDRLRGLRRLCDFGAVLRGLAAFAAARLAAAFFATFVDLMDVLLAIAFTRRCLRYALRNQAMLVRTYAVELISVSVLPICAACSCFAAISASSFATSALIAVIRSSCTRSVSR